MQAEDLYQQYEHPLWQAWQTELSRKYPLIGHGGGDSVMWHKVLTDMLAGRRLDMNVYDAVTLSVVSELTEISRCLGGQPVEFPDFTRGYWRDWRPANY